MILLITLLLKKLSSVLPRSFEEVMASFEEFSGDLKTSSSDLPAKIKCPRVVSVCYPFLHPRVGCTIFCSVSSKKII